MSTQFPFITVTHHPVRNDPFFTLTIDIVNQDVSSNTSKLSYELAIEPNGCPEVYLKNFLARIYYMDEYQTCEQQDLNVVWNYDPNNHADSLSKNNKVTQRTVLRRGQHTIRHNGYGDAKYVYFELSGTVSYRKKDGTFVEDENFVQSQDEKNKCKTELPPLDIASIPEMVVDGKDFGKPYTIKAKFMHPGSTDIKGPMGNTDINQYGYKVTYRYEFDNEWDERGSAYAKGTENINITIPKDDMNMFPSDTDVPIIFRLETQYGLNGSSPQVGSYKYLNATIHVPDNIIPNPPKITYVDKVTNEAIKSWKILVEKYSSLDLSVTANGMYASTITKLVLTGDVKAESTKETLTATTGVLTAGTKKYIAYCIDSRGRKSGDAELVLNVESYSEPKISKFSVNRDAVTALVTINADWDWTTLGGRNNAGTALFYRTMASAQWVKYPNGINKNADTQLQGTFPVEDPYVFQFAVKDAVGNTTRYTVKIENSPKMFDMLPRNEGLGIGKKCEAPGLEIGFNTTFFGGVELFNTQGEKVTLEQYILDAVKK